MINPFIKSSNRFTSYVVIWFAISVIHLFTMYVVLKIDFYDALSDSLVFNIIYLGIGLSLWYPTKFISFENYSILKILINHILAAVVTSGIWVLLGYFILVKVFGVEGYQKGFLYQSLVWRFLIGIFFYSIIVSLNYLLIYYTNFQEKIIKESELRALVKESEIKTLKYQINPHFVFNSLNSISSLTISNPKSAREMTIKLSNFLRYTLSKNEKQKHKLCEEIDNVKLYLDIEKIRFHDKFEFIEELSEDCKSLEVPSMILQPLFENAIKHGVYESVDNVIIKLICREEDNYLRITVENEFDPDAVSKKGEGIGLSNIQNRLKLIYNQDNLLTTRKSVNIFRANIYIPLEGEN
ncbi:sensor histidine kinase [Bacteroidota bacterium]